MRESIKVVCVAVFMFAVPTAAVVWTDDRPNNVVRILQIASPIVSAVAIGLFLKLHFRADIVPDYLYRYVGNYFNRGGFCFGFRPIAKNGICFVEAYFQNQTDRPCRGRIALRPARGFFLGREQIATVTFDIACEPAAFGVARIAIPLPERVQGKRQSFDVGASVEYPPGKGRTLRFRDGLAVRETRSSAMRSALHSPSRVR